MRPKMQDLTFTIYPPGEEPRQWQLRAYVFGEWVVHKHHPNESDETYWCISHIPTCAAAFIADHVEPAIHAAVLLSKIESPGAEVIEGENGPKIAPLAIEWIAACAKALDGVDVWSYGRNYRPAEMIEVIKRERSISAGA